MRGGGVIGSRRRRPSRPVRLRLERIPRVGPPAATRSSSVCSLAGFARRVASASGCAAAPAPAATPAAAGPSASASCSLGVGRGVVALRSATLSTRLTFGARPSHRPRPPTSRGLAAATAAAAPAAAAAATALAGGARRSTRRPRPSAVVAGVAAAIGARPPRRRVCGARRSTASVGRRLPRRPTAAASLDGFRSRRRRRSRRRLRSVDGFSFAGERVGRRSRRSRSRCERRLRRRPGRVPGRPGAGGAVGPPSGRRRGSLAVAGGRRRRRRVRAPGVGRALRLCLGHVIHAASSFRSAEGAVRRNGTTDGRVWRRSEVVARAAERPARRASCGSRTRSVSFGPARRARAAPGRCPATARGRAPLVVDPAPSRTARRGRAHLQGG